MSQNQFKSLYNTSVSKFYASDNALLYYTNLARQWATQDNTPVDGNLYSAKHYAESASDVITSGMASITTEINSAINGIKNDLRQGTDFISAVENNALHADGSGLYVDLTDINDAIDNNSDDIESTNNKIGNLEILQTSNKTSIVSAINSVVSEKSDVDLTNVNNQGTALSTSWMTTDASSEIQITPPASSSSGNTLANTTLFTAPCNGWVTVEATTNNSSGRFWVFGASSIIISSTFMGNMQTKVSTIFVKKGEQVLLRGAYVSVINSILFYPCEGVKWEVQ